MRSLNHQTWLSITATRILYYYQMRILLSILSLLATAHTARFLHSIPEDTYAFPKFRVSFLNSLPLINETAQRWLKEGLPGGELEFLDQPWEKDNSHFLKEIGSGQLPSGDTSMTDVYPSFLLTLDNCSVLLIVYLVIICSSN